MAFVQEEESNAPVEEPKKRETKKATESAPTDLESLLEEWED